MPRNYRKEYDNYHSKPKQKKNRAKRNAARATMEKAGRVRKGDGGRTLTTKPQWRKAGATAKVICA